MRPGRRGKPPIYQVGGKSFVFFRNPRPDAFDPETGERYDDVIVFWVADEADKRSLVEDPGLAVLQHRRTSTATCRCSSGASTCRS